MFDRLTAGRSGGRRRRLAWIAGSTLAQLALLAVLIIASGRAEHKRAEAPSIPVLILGRPGPPSVPALPLAPVPGARPSGRDPATSLRHAAAPTPVMAKAAPRGRLRTGSAGSTRAAEPRSPPAPLAPAKPDPAASQSSEDRGGSTSGAGAQLELGAESGVGAPGAIPGGSAGGAPGAAGAAGTGPVDMSAAIVAPVLVSAPPLEYTREALEHEVEGTMEVQCIVTVAGTVRDCHAVRTVPFMERAVVGNLQERRYRPATLDGKAIDVRYTFTIRLRLP